MYQTQNQVQNKPTAAYWLTLIGGILGLLVALYVIVVLGALTLYAALEYSYYFIDAFAYVWIGFGVWMFIASILLIRFARKLNANPMQHSKYGAYIIILSILGVGSFLGFVGGILALVYKPIPVGAAPQYAPQQYAPAQPQYYGPPPQQAAYTPPQQPASRYCPQCGTIVQNGVRFCPNCGKQVN